ncbi:MAG: hypothetical protein WC523_03795 [Patescibacteria group bacterium]
MIRFPSKRIYGLIGPPRAGKDAVAQYLKETRGFVILAFADQIKQEFGISKEDFESAKISGNIEKIRQDLWDFSADMKKKDPNYFIHSLMERAEKEQSVVISDVRTEDELDAIYSNKFPIKRAYYIMDSERNDTDGEFIKGSKIKAQIIDKHIDADKDMRLIINNKKGLFYFYQELDRFFFNEDVGDMLSNESEIKAVRSYLQQFNVWQKGSIYES